MSDWAVYLLRCADGTLYTGISTDPARRLRQHNGEINGGARYTRTRRPVELLYCLPCGDRSAASRKEAEIKSMCRADKEAWLSRVAHACGDGIDGADQRG